ncbi:hypothetical protein BH09BAC5_BH09BAC5_25240 [soil metagenome]
MAITVDCMRNAAKVYGNENVIFASAQFDEDLVFVPDDFIATKNLTRSFNDVSGITGKKKLPLIADILSGLKQFPDADYYIYSNTDIAPYPEFYSSIAKIIDQSGNDALIINRRRLPEEYADKNLEELTNEKGLPHPGYDCFVFKKELLEKLDLKMVAVGIPGIGFLFAHNLFLHAKSPKVLYDEILTFHIGLEIIKEWSSKEETAFQHNQIRAFLKEKRNHFRISNFPGYRLPFFKRHFRWLMNPLFHYPTMLRLDLKNLFDGRKIIHDEKNELCSFDVYAQPMNFSK